MNVTFNYMMSMCSWRFLSKLRRQLFSHPCKRRLYTPWAALTPVPTRATSAASLIWINFDRHSLLNLIQQCAGTFVADVDEIRPQYSQVAHGGAVFQSTIVRSAGPSIGATINTLDTQTLTSAGQNAQLATPWYSDQVLPFDITLSGANEYGAMCAAKIYGVEILNESYGISIDDAVSEMHLNRNFLSWLTNCRPQKAVMVLLRTLKTAPPGLDISSKLRHLKSR
jgi:hypothetical protein